MNNRTKKIYIASDHAGYFLKEKIKNYLSSINYLIDDIGTYSEESVDYPDIAHKFAEKIIEDDFSLGIILCGSGNGVNIVVNKYPNIRSALCWNEEIARLAKQHNNANVIAIPARFLDEKLALEIVKSYLNSTFEGGRHQLRVDKI